MNRYLGTIICYALRRHKFRRLRKSEATGADDAALIRICDRCAATKMVKARGKK